MLSNKETDGLEDMLISSVKNMGKFCNLKGSFTTKISDKESSIPERRMYMMRICLKQAGPSTVGHTKTDAFSEKFQRAFDPPPHFRKILLQFCFLISPV